MINFRDIGVLGEIAFKIAAPLVEKLNKQIAEQQQPKE